MMSKRRYARAGRGVCLVLAMLAFSGCIRSPEEKEARFLEAGKKALASGDYARALIQFRNAALIKKADAEPYYQLALAYLGTADYNRGYAALEKAVQLNPKHLKAQIKLAELLRATGNQKNLEESETRIKDVLALAPNDSDALNARALTEVSRGKRDEARRSFEQAIEQAPQNLQAARNLALVKRADNDLAGAEQVLKSAIASNPKLPAPLVMLGDFYWETQRVGAAEQQYLGALQLDPKNPPALVKLADLYATTQRNSQAEQLYKQISALPDPAFRPVHAIFLFSSGKRDQAVVEFERLAKDAPSDRAARSRLVEAYFAVNRISDAEKLLTEALRKNGRDTDALLQRSRVYLLAGSVDEARKDLTEVLRLQNNSAEAHYLMAKVHQMNGVTLSARQEFYQALQFDRTLLPARLDLARLLLVSNAPKTVLELLNETAVPKANLTVLGLRNWALFATGDVAGFRKGVSDALALGRTPDVLLQDAIVKLQRRDAAGARASIDAVLAQNPRDLRAFDLLVMTYRVQKRPADVLPKLREVAAKYPNSPDARTVLGDWLLSTGDRAGAREAFTTALKVDPHHVAATVGLAQADAADGKLDEARKALQSMQALEPGSRTITMLLANVEEKSGNLGKALELYTKVLGSDPSNIQALNNTAYLLADYANKPDEALKYAERAKELAPKSPAIDDTLGWVLYHKGLYSAAVPHLEAASAKLKQAVPEYHLSMAYFKAGDHKRGSQVLQAALQRDPNVPEAALARRVQAESAKVSK